MISIGEKNVSAYLSLKEELSATASSRKDKGHNMQNSSSEAS